MLICITFTDQTTEIGKKGKQKGSREERVHIGNEYKNNIVFKLIPNLKLLNLLKAYAFSG
jgi:hypothetical protein